MINLNEILAYSYEQLEELTKDQKYSELTISDWDLDRECILKEILYKNNNKDLGWTCSFFINKNKKLCFLNKINKTELKVYDEFEIDISEQDFRLFNMEQKINTLQKENRAIAYTIGVNKKEMEKLNKKIERLKFCLLKSKKSKRKKK